ncbi:MAG: 4Fe-4S dicluster domain-containing protein [Phycisphaerales bacterium]|nr:4Fe-4S dicluster domain-containing protein [Phycisphaerales bacterium]
MFLFLTRRKRIPGGLHFGPPAWHPTKIEIAQSPDHQITQSPDRPPTSRAELIALLHRINLHNTSVITPGLLEQLERAKERNILTLVLNLLPTQPEFALPAALSRIALPEILSGLNCIQTVLQPRRTHIVLDRYDLRSRRIWRRVRKSQKKSPLPYFTLKPLVNQYPIAHPTLLIRKLFGRRLAVGKLPTRFNCIIIDPVTCWALGRHLLTGQPFTQRPVQLFTAGPKEASARLVLADLTETVEQLCRRYGVILSDEKIRAATVRERPCDNAETIPVAPSRSRLGSSHAAKQVILNGMLAGQQIDPLQTTITSATESISIRDLPAAEISAPCFACGWCVDVCPTELNPVTLFEIARQTQQASSEPHTPQAREAIHCIGCGLCSYVCPTRLPLTQETLRLRNLVQQSTP